MLSILFQATDLQGLALKNRIVMAPLTRNRALGNIPNELMATYYAQRASAGLIIAEGTSPSPNGLGYARIPGLFSTEQVKGWRKVTEAVHAAGGKIFVQLMHTGRVGSAINLPERARVLAPSALRLSGEVYTDTQGMQPYDLPDAMTEADIHTTIDEYERAAVLAMEAGFDGVEIHAANGYLIEQFINPSANQRQDAWGGSIEGRLRFVLTIAQRITQAIGGNRVGIRVSPYGVFNDMGHYPEIEATYTNLAQNLNAYKLAYMHIVDHSSMGAPEVTPRVKQSIRSQFQGKLILSGGYDLARAEADLTEGRADLIAFGRAFISNPNLVHKLENHSRLNEANPASFYSPGPEGYTDYPAN